MFPKLLTLHVQLRGPYLTFCSYGESPCSIPQEVSKESGKRCQGNVGEGEGQEGTFIEGAENGQKRVGKVKRVIGSHSLSNSDTDTDS